MRYANAQIRFSEREKRDLVKAWFWTSVAFAVYFIRAGFVNASGLTLSRFLVILGIAATTAGVGFIVHELAHKLAAHKYMVFGEFRANNGMLFMSVLLAIMGLLIAAPGAVHIMGRVNRKVNGIISASGPASNLVLALIFMPFAFMGGIIGMIGMLGAFINAILGAFNLIPFGFFDGAKIMGWNKPVYFTLVIVAVILVVLSYGLMGAI